jgi:hypothetical protein
MQESLDCPLAVCQHASALPLLSNVQCLYPFISHPFGTGLNTRTVSSVASSPLVLVIFPPFIDPEDQTRDAQERNEVSEAESLGLENALQDRKVNDGHLAQEASANREIKHPIAKQLHLAARDALIRRPTRQGIEHIEEDETGEGHGRVARRDFSVRHFARIHEQCAEHDDACGSCDAADEGFG